MRPLIGIVGRRAAKSSVLRYSGTIAAETLLDAVLRAGGEPVILHGGLPADLACYRLSRTSRSANKLAGAINAWHLYRQVSMLPIPLAVFWWLQYAWSALTLYHRARPRERRA